VLDFAEASVLKFARINVNTYDPYLKETWWLGNGSKFGLKSALSLRCGDKGVVALDSLRALFASLTKNAKEVFFIVARHHLKKKADEEGSFDFTILSHFEGRNKIYIAVRKRKNWFGLE
jgi:hypothetical protein